MAGYLGWGDIFDYSIIDTSVIGNYLREAGVITLDKMSLGNLAETLGISFDKTQLHTALVDAELSAKCYFIMLNLMRKNYRKEISR